VCGGGEGGRVTRRRYRQEVVVEWRSKWRKDRRQERDKILRRNRPA